MKKYDTFKDLFADICEIKAFVVKLHYEDLRNYRNDFYSQPFPEWRLNLLWEYIWGDISYNEIKAIFENSRLI